MRNILMEPIGNAINPLTKQPIYGDPASAISGVSAGASLISIPFLNQMPMILF